MTFQNVDNICYFWHSGKVGRRALRRDPKLGSDLGETVKPDELVFHENKLLKHHLSKCYNLNKTKEKKN